MSGGRDNVIRVWDMEAMVCRRTLTGHKNDVLCINSMVNGLGLVYGGSMMPLGQSRGGARSRGGNGSGSDGGVSDGGGNNEV